MVRGRLGAGQAPPFLAVGDKLPPIIILGHLVQQGRGASIGPPSVCHEPHGRMAV
jgi:hypothetical protein